MARENIIDAHSRIDSCGLDASAANVSSRHLRQTSGTEEKVHGAMEAPRKGPASACVSQWRKPNPLAMTQMRTAREASEEGRRRAVSPFVSVGGKPCPTNKDAGRPERKTQIFINHTSAKTTRKQSFSSRPSGPHLGQAGGPPQGSWNCFWFPDHIRNETTHKQFVWFLLSRMRHVMCPSHTYTTCTPRAPVCKCIFPSLTDPVCTCSLHQCTRVGSRSSRL